MQHFWATEMKISDLSQTLKHPLTFHPARNCVPLMQIEQISLAQTLSIHCHSLWLNFICMQSSSVPSVRTTVAGNDDMLVLDRSTRVPVQCQNKSSCESTCASPSQYSWASSLKINNDYIAPQITMHQQYHIYFYGHNKLNCNQNEVEHYGKMNCTSRKDVRYSPQLSTDIVSLFDA